eukprot:PhF_6_TR21179/c0_g1_i2/m.30528
MNPVEIARLMHDMRKRPASKDIIHSYVSQALLIPSKHWTAHTCTVVLVESSIAKASPLQLFTHILHPSNIHNIRFHAVQVLQLIRAMVLRNYAATLIGTNTTLRRHFSEVMRTNWHQSIASHGMSFPAETRNLLKHMTRHRGGGGAGSGSFSLVEPTPLFSKEMLLGACNALHKAGSEDDALLTFHCGVCEGIAQYDDRRKIGYGSYQLSRLSFVSQCILQLPPRKGYFQLENMESIVQCLHQCLLYKITLSEDCKSAVEKYCVAAGAALHNKTTTKSSLDKVRQLFCFADDLHINLPWESGITAVFLHPLMSVKDAVSFPLFQKCHHLVMRQHADFGMRLSNKCLQELKQYGELSSEIVTVMFDVLAKVPGWSFEPYRMYCGNVTKMPTKLLSITQLLLLHNRENVTPPPHLLETVLSNPERLQINDMVYLAAYCHSAGVAATSLSKVFQKMPMEGTKARALVQLYVPTNHEISVMEHRRILPQSWSKAMFWMVHLNKWYHVPIPSQDRVADAMRESLFGGGAVGGTMDFNDAVCVLHQLKTDMYKGDSESLPAKVVLRYLMDHFMTKGITGKFNPAQIAQLSPFIDPKVLATL